MTVGERADVDIIRSRAALEALASEWDGLMDAAAPPMPSHDWVHACAETLHPEGDLHVVTVRLRRALAGIAPLVLTARAGLRRLELIGSAALHEPSGLLYDSDEALDALVGAIVRLRTPVLLSRFPTHSPIVRRFRSIGSARGVVFAKRVAGTIAVPIASDWSAYLAQLSSRRRYDLERARRRTEEAGAVTVRVENPRPEDIDGMFATLVRIEGSGWKRRNASSLTQRDSLRQFFLAYARRAAKAGLVRFSFLDVDGVSIAAQLSVEYRNRLWVLKIGYDEQWSRCSPGWQLLAETMRYAFERKLTAYEFLGSDEPWLHRWITEPRDLSTLAYYPASLAGMYGWAAVTVERVRARLSSASR